VIPASIQLGSLSSAVFTNLVLRANDAFTMKSIKDFQGKLFIGDQLYISLRSEDHEYGGWVEFNDCLKIGVLQFAIRELQVVGEEWWVPSFLEGFDYQQQCEGRGG
jgi:hypothetical protein